MIAEVIGGYLSESLAIMTDAAHLLSDLLAFCISIYALLVAQRAPTNKLTFGSHRAEIVGALTSVILIWGLTIWLVYEAVLRVIDPPKVDGKIMLITAVFGFICNLIMMGMLHDRPEGAGKIGGHAHSHGDGHGAHGAHSAHGSKPKKSGHGHGGKKCTGHGGHGEKKSGHGGHGEKKPGHGGHGGHSGHSAHGE